MVVDLSIAYTWLIRIGVLLIDPSITEGYPLWRGYRPFKNSPTPKNRTGYEVPPKTNLFEDLIFWVRQTSQQDIDAIENNPRAMAFRILEIICAEVSVPYKII